MSKNEQINTLRIISFIAILRPSLELVCLDLLPTSDESADFNFHIGSQSPRNITNTAIEQYPLYTF